MDRNIDHINSLAYCGLICNLCFRSKECDGCKKAGNACDRNCSVEGCYQKNCCLKKGLEGCWECADIYNCEQGLYSLGNLSKVKAFAICIKEDGKAKFLEYIMRNMENGWSVEKGKDYDNKTIKEVLLMLRTGHRP